MPPIFLFSFLTQARTSQQQPLLGKIRRRVSSFYVWSLADVPLLLRIRGVYSTRINFL